MAKRIVDYDPFSGITTTMDYNAETDTTIVGREHPDVEPVLERNKILANDTESTRKGIKNDWWFYGHIPDILIEKWRTEEGIDVFNRNHEKRVWQKINSPEYRFLKTTMKMHTPR